MKGGDVNIPSSYTVKVGGTGGNVIQVDSDLDNIHVKEFPEVAFRVKELPTMTLNSNVAVKELPTMRLESRSDVNIAIKEIPEQRVHLPAHYQLAFSFFGIEIWKLALCGEGQIINEKYSPRRTETCS
ncbi:MAG TPA: hypothetical protein VG095_05905 [Chthoniobacterales bacterium]|nr:hypothetical protein [Chthoniobacterales bacterium]